MARFVSGLVAAYMLAFGLALPALAPAIGGDEQISASDAEAAASKNMLQRPLPAAKARTRPTEGETAARETAAREKIASETGAKSTTRARYDCALVGRKILNDNGVQVSDIVVAGVVAGVVGMAIVAGAKEENARNEARNAEIKCLASHGLRQQGLCACPQMSHCRGSWARMQCNELKTLCRDTPSNKVYEKNSCAKLKKLVGGF